MLLAINIGNTNVAFGLYDQQSWLVEKIPTHKIEEESNHLQIKSFLEQHKSHITECVIASVVPEKSKTIKKIIKSLEIQPIKKIEDACQIGLDIQEYGKQPPGIDRLLCCLAANKKSNNVNLVFDFGTATTANVTQNNIFFGGAILPGLGLAAKVLAQETALLPAINFQEETVAIGKNTKECMQSGIVYSAVGFVETYSNKVKEIMGQAPTVFITGGNADKIIPYLSVKYLHYPNLLLEGLANL